MDFIWGSGTGFGRDVPTHSEQDLRAGARGDWRIDSPAGSQRDLRVELHRGLQSDSQEDLRSGFCCDFDGALRI